MKTIVKAHAVHLTLAGVITPIALVLGTLIANEAQTLLGLHLEGAALAIYLIPFLTGAALVLKELVKRDAASLIQSFIGGVGTGLVSPGLFGGVGQEAPKTTVPPPPTPPPPAP